MRSTFEARGYTAWDPTSAPWLLKSGGAVTLVIPTAFVSWTGEALDKKTPLLRSMEALSKQAVRVLKLFGSTAERVVTTCGSEQEYFLIDRYFYLSRPDLINAGRTLFGARPPKGQELEDQYFGAIADRVMAFMSEVESELYKVGVPVKTRHNEVAPSQYEIAPVFENANLATDHQMMTMETMRRAAPKFGLACLLHEKPFAGVNESLDYMATELEKAVKGGKSLQQAVAELLPKVIKENKRIIFNGNNYSKEWEKEAAKRGLQNLKNTVDALPQLISKEVVSTFEKYKVLNGRELHARYDIMVETYNKTVNVEGQLMVLMANRYVLPAALEYQKQVAQSVAAVKAAGGTSVEGKKTLTAIVKL